MFCSRCIHDCRQKNSTTHFVRPIGLPFSQALTVAEFANVTEKLLSLQYEQLKSQLLADMMAIPTFFPALLRLVSRGEPVPIAALATEVDIPIHDIEKWLRRQPVCLS